MRDDQLRRIWSIDAEAPLQSVLDSPECPPLLRQTLTGALFWQVRNEVPVRRALSAPRTAPQWIAALLALGATVTVERDDEAAEMPLDVLTQRRTEGTISALHIPHPKESGIRWARAAVARTPADDPIVAVVAAIEMETNVVRQARIALTGAWPETARLAESANRLVGNPLDQTHIQETAQAVEREVAPKADFLGSEPYRRAMAGVLTRRALQKCQLQET
jgi:CO/xanthine dehydrogenase FAD-binding subunit